MNDRSARRNRPSSPLRNGTNRWRRRARRSVVAILALAAAWHIFATFLWIAPVSGLRAAVPGNLLHSYMIPMNGQSWSVFAPAPINGDYRLQVRAHVQNGTSSYTTPWVDATKVETSMLTHHLFPPRAAIQSTELASRFKSSYDKLTTDHKVVVKLGYFEGDHWEQRLTAKLDSYGGQSAVHSYMHEEHELTAFSTQVAYALWGAKVTRIQFVVSRRNVVPYGERNDPHAQRPAPQVALTGWRGTVEEAGQSRSDFASVFRKAYAESGQ